MNLRVRSTRFRIARPGGPDEVTGFVLGLMGINPTASSIPSWWTITHLPTGLALTYAASFDEAHDIAIALHWTGDAERMASDTFARHAWPADIVMAIRERNNLIGDVWARGEGCSHGG